MATVQQLVQELHAGGALDSEGGFTLDSEKARDKLRQYQLARPHEYVLLLVQAAVLRGATSIQFDIDADDVRMQFDGRPFTRDELADLYSAMFMDRTSRDVQARQELALALNAAMALNPRYIRVLSGDAERRVFLELRPDRGDKLDDVKPSVAGTWIHVKQRFRPGLVVQFVRNIRGTIAEELALQERCRYADIEITLDGASITQGMTLEGLVAATPVEGDAVKGVVGFMPPEGDDEAPPAAIDVLYNGVALTRRELPELPRRLRGLVDGTHLKKDVSQFKVVRDDAYETMIAAVRAACDAAIVALLGHYKGAKAPRWERALARDCLALWSEAWRTEAGDERSPADVSPVAAAVTGVRLWTTIAHRRVTTRALLEREGDVEYATREFDGYVPEDMDNALLVPDAEDVALLERVLGLGRFKDATRKLERAFKHNQNRLAWRRRVQPPHLGDGVYLARAPIVDEGVGGEVALRQLGSQGCEVRMVKDGCLLYEVAPRFGVPGVVAVLVADYQPNSAYDAAHRNKNMARALHGLLAAIERMMTSFAAWLLDSLPDGEAPEPSLRGLALGFLIHSQSPGYALDFFEQFGFSKQVARRYLSSMDLAYKPDWKLEEDPHPLARLPLFRSHGAGHLSLVQLGSLALQGQRIQWVERLPTEALDGVPATLVELSEDERKALAQVFGKSKLRDFQDELSRLALRARFFERPEHSMTLTVTTVCEHRFEHEGVTGVLGVFETALRAKTASTNAVVTVLKHMRAIGTHSFSLGLLGVVGVVNDDDAPIDAAWSELEHGGPRLRLEDATLACAAGLVDGVYKAYLDRVGDARACLIDVLMSVLVTVFDSPLLVAAYLSLRDELGDEEGDAAFTDILRLLEGATHKQLVNAVQAARDRGDELRAPVIKGLLARSVGKKARRDPRAALRVGLMAHVASIMSLELLRTTAGRSISLERALARPEIYYVDASSPEIYYDGEERLIVRVTQRQQQALISLAGRAATHDAMGWLYTWSQKQAFARRPALEALIIADDDALVTVDVDERGIRGQLGLRRWSVDQGGGASVRVCTTQRVVCALDLELELPIVGVLDVDDLEVKDDFSGIEGASAHRVKRFCEDKIDLLLAELASRWAALNVNGVTAASKWVIHAMVVRARGAGGNRRRLNTDGLRALADVPAFPGLDEQRYSLNDLSELYRERKRLPHVEPGFSGNPPRFPVVIADAWLRGELDALFPTLEDYRETWARERAIDRRRRDASPLPDAPPRDALFSVSVGDKGLTGYLWVTPRMPARPSIHFGQGGKIVEHRTLEEGFPCEGAISVTPARVNETWEKVNLARKQQHALKRAIHRLYRELVARYDKLTRVEHGGDGTIVERVAEAFGASVTPDQLHRVLVPLMLELHKNRAADKSTNTRTLYRKLRALPMLDLGNGRLISLEVALDERPSQLAHLKLWFTAPSGWKEQLAALGDGDDDASGTKKTKSSKSSKRSKSKKKKKSAKPPTQPETKAPTPEPPPPATPAQRLLDAVRSELRLVRGRDHELLSNAHLDALDTDARAGGTVVFERDARFYLNLSHPVVARAVEHFEEDQLHVSVLASAVYTLLNAYFEVIEDSHEEVFHALHARHVLSGAAARPRPRVRSGEIG